MSELPAPLPDPSQSQPPVDSSPGDPPIPSSGSIVPPDDSPRIETPAAAMASAMPEGLSDHQRKVMTYLATGHSIAKAAHLGKVNRRTVYRWLNDDAQFCAVYNAWRRELEQSAKTRLLAMADDAIDTIHGAILTGHVNASLTVAKSMGLLTKPRIGPDDPERILRKRRAREMRQTANELRAIDSARDKLPYNHPLRHAPEERAQMAENDRRRREESEKQQHEQQPEWVERYRQANERDASNSAQEPQPQPDSQSDPAAPTDQSGDSDHQPGCSQS